MPLLFDVYSVWNCRFIKMSLIKFMFEYKARKIKIENFIILYAIMCLKRVLAETGIDWDSRA